MSVPSEPVDFDDWVAPHLALLRALAIREVGRDDADDVVQEALVRAWRRRSTFRPEHGTARSWLVAVLLDQARRSRSRRLRRPTRVIDDADGGAQQSSSETDRVYVERAIGKLPRRQREVITLFYLADLSVDEVATVLGIKPGSVKSHLHDARSALRLTLERS